MPRETLEAVRAERDTARADADRWQARALKLDTLLQLIKGIAGQAEADDR